ncbi:uncharacterized protein LOC121838990 [Oncorhynchus tshawytscha]|uniref:uncharacterized protein LOC121838990 n=1 Tax=Oncorhynchus tshawytscha TaxID=74940 RepID=UPI001C3D9DB5|nr:uncharacterized protein LOC121838990 [Oncorhynchus tshawytscha]
MVAVMLLLFFITIQIQTPNIPIKTSIINPMDLTGCLSENNHLIAQTSRQMIPDDPFRPRRTALKRSWSIVGPFPRSLWIHPGVPEDDFDRVCAKIWRDSKKAGFGIWSHMEKDSMAPANEHPPDQDIPPAPDGRAEEDPVRPQNIHGEVRDNKCPVTRRKPMLIKITDPRLDEISLMVGREFQTLTSQTEKERRGLSDCSQRPDDVRCDDCSHGDDPIWETQVEKKEEEKVIPEEEQRRDIEKFLRGLLIPGQEDRGEDSSNMVEPLDIPNPFLLNPDLGANLSPLVPDLLPDLSPLLHDLAPNLAPSEDDFPPLPSAASPWQGDRLWQGSPPANLPTPLIPIPGPFNLLGKVAACIKASAPAQAPTPAPVPAPAKVPAIQVTASARSSTPAPAKVPAMKITVPAATPAPAKVPATRITDPTKARAPSTTQQELYDLMADFPALQPQGKAPPLGLQQPANTPCRAPTTNVELLLQDLPYSALFKAQEGDRELGRQDGKRVAKGPKKMESEPEEEPQDITVVTDDVDQWPEITTTKQPAFTQATQQVIAGTDGASAWVGSANESVRRAAAPLLQKARPLRSPQEGPERRQTTTPVVPAAPTIANIAAAFATSTAANDLPQESKAGPRQQAPPPSHQGIPSTNQRRSHRYAGFRPQNAHRPGFTCPTQGCDVRTSAMTTRMTLDPVCMSGDGHPQKPKPHLYSESLVERVTAVGSRCPVNAPPGFTKSDRGPRRNLF